MARHPILRTAFVWEAAEGPLQVVHQKVRVPRSSSTSCLASPPEAQAARRSGCSLDADRERGFDLSKAPLMRLALIGSGTSSIARCGAITT